jgi:hypothetical protein
MRSLFAWLAGTILAGSLMVLAPGCGGASSTGTSSEGSVAPTPETTKAMPGYNEAQVKLKKEGKIR